MENLGQLNISGIARIVKREWKNVNYAAAPYLSAMSQIDDIADDYYDDKATTVVRYFLANATCWRGDIAKAVNAELKSRLAGKK